MGLLSLCGKKAEKPTEEEEAQTEKTEKIQNILEDYDKEVNDEKLRRLIEIQTKEIKELLDIIHRENIQFLGTKSYDEDKNHLSEILQKILELLSRKIIDFNTDFQIKNANDLSVFIYDARDLIQNKSNEIFSNHIIIFNVLPRIPKILF